VYNHHSSSLIYPTLRHEPSAWSLSWTRFEFELEGSDAAVLSYAPNVNGIKAEIEKNGSRKLNISLSSELGPSLALDAKLSPSVTYDRNNGWGIKYEKTIEEIKGFKTRAANGKILLQWDIYENKSMAIPESNLGITSGVYASALISIAKHSKATIGVKVSGETVPKGFAKWRHGAIELTSGAQFDVVPTL